MSQGSFGTLAKNVKNFAPGLVALATNGSSALATWKKIYDRGQKYAPVEFREQKEHYSRDYFKRHHHQQDNFFIDKELSTEVSQRELGELIQFKLDFWTVSHLSASLPLFGGLPLFGLPLLLANNKWVPSTFNVTPEELSQWRNDQDLYRYRFAPLYCTEVQTWADVNVPVTADAERGWEELFEKNDVRRDPNACRVAAHWYEPSFPFHEARRKTMMYLLRAQGLPSFPALAKMCMGSRLRDYWMLIWNEDYMVISQKSLDKLSDSKLYEFAWRRFLAPYDKNLNREQLLTRINDYHEFLGKDFVESTKTPNFFVTTSYCLGYYNDPAFLIDDISELDKNDHDGIVAKGADAFVRRLSFENGELRDQVEAHTEKLKAQRQAQRAALPQ